MKDKWKKAFMETANIFSALSSAQRLKVGSIIVKNNRIISIGYNGTNAGWDNTCESMVDGELKTKPEVIHSEMNCIAKLAASGESSQGATMFVTHSPCMECAKLIAASEIKAVFYETLYRSDDGIKHLKKSGVKVKQLRKKDK
jgi:dCMP deaminase